MKQEAYRKLYNKGIMLNKEHVAYLLQLCYNETLNMVLPRRCWKQPGAWIHSLEECILDTIRPNSEDGNKQPENTVPSKQCNKCQHTFPLTLEHFSPEKRNKNGFSSWCKKCRNDQIQAYKAKQSAIKNNQNGNKQPVIPDGMKQCRKCLNILPATKEYFTRVTKKKDGLSCYCKTCDKITRKGKPEKQRQYYETHKEEMALNKKKYYEMHREETCTRARGYYKENKESVKDRLKQYYQTERGKIIRRANTHNRRALKKNAPGKHTAKELREQFTRQKGTCYYCKTKLETGRASWHEDHIVPLSRGGSNDIHNIVITCPTCNLKKHNKLPHEWDEGGRLL